MGWFTDALSQVQQAAEQASSQAKQAAEQMQVQAAKAAEQVAAQAKDIGGKVGEAVANPDIIAKTFAFDEAGAQREAPAQGVAAWDNVPPAWKGRGRAWRALAKALIEDENSFLVGPMQRTEPATIDWTLEDVPDVDQIACAKLERMLDVHSSLAPRLVSDVNFWRNYYWTVREVGKCADVAGVRAKLQILNVDPTTPPLAVGETQRGRGITHAKSKIAEIIRQVEAEEVASKRLTDLARTIEDEIKTSEENSSLLLRIISRGRGGGSSSDLRDSVYESCKYHHEKVLKLIAQVKDESAEDQGDLQLPGLESARDKLAEAIAGHVGEGGEGEVAEAKKEEPAAPTAAGADATAAASSLGVDAAPSSASGGAGGGAGAVAGAPTTVAAVPVKLVATPTTPPKHNDPADELDFDAESLGFTPPDDSALATLAAAGGDDDDCFGGALPWEDEPETDTPQGTQPTSAAGSWTDAAAPPSPGK